MLNNDYLENYNRTMIKLHINLGYYDKSYWPDLKKYNGEASFQLNGSKIFFLEVTSDLLIVDNIYSIKKKQDQTGLLSTICDGPY